MKLGTRVGLGPGHIVLDGDPAPPSPNMAQPPNVRPISFAAKWLHGSRCHLVEIGLGPGDFVLDGNPPPLPKKGTEPPPQFSAHFYCGQTSGRIKMPLGVEVGLSPGDFALDGDPALLPQQGLRLRISKLARSAGYFQL